MCGSGVKILNLDFNDAQGDKKVFDFYAAMGADIRKDKELTVYGGRKLKAVTLDLNSTPDALPVISATCALIDGESRLLNVAQARNKETDRIAAIVAQLGALGLDVSEHSSPPFALSYRDFVKTTSTLCEFIARSFPAHPVRASPRRFPRAR